MKAFVPHPIQFNILILLPVKSLTRFKCLSKFWCSLISGEEFICAHKDGGHQCLIVSSILYEQELFTNINFFINTTKDDRLAILKYSAPVSYDSYHVLPSCNGLVCFYGAYNHSIYICNPSTKFLVMLPNSCKKTSGSFSCGFGFDQASCKYKVIKMFEDSKSSDPGNIISPCSFKFSIFTLGNSTWRTVKDRSCFQMQNRQPPIFAKGFFYWITSNSSGSVIVSFDVSNERFGFVHPPEGLLNKNWYLSSLQELGGDLCFVDLDFALEGNKRIDIWIFKGIGCSGRWTQDSVIHQSEALHLVRPVALQGREVLLHGLINGLSPLNWYDLDTKCFRPANLIGVPFSHYCIGLHVETLVEPLI